LEAQKDVWGHGPGAFMFGSSTGMPTVKKVSDGLVVSGKWTYASGCLHGDWGLIMVPLCNEAGEKTGQALGLCRVSELVIEDTWHAAGMKGTGSRTIVAQEVFIPTIAFSRWLLSLGQTGRRPIRMKLCIARLCFLLS
jgi:3-hydroxy-9,10-secoandrosta-1,3,5(10)-triene-9,17-dione monooxygenase